jgi:hypothetical protein
MSDIGKIQKINEMSANLKKHGFASSSEEAAKEAEKYFKEEIAKAEEGAEKMDSDIGKIERNLEVFKNFTSKEIEALKDDLHSVVEKMNEIVKFINRIEAQKKAPIDVPEEQEKMPKPPTRKQKQATLKNPDPKPKNERVGDLKPGDVSIEDTFYFGTK